MSRTISLGNVAPAPAVRAMFLSQPVAGSTIGDPPTGFRSQVSPQLPARMRGQGMTSLVVTTLVLPRYGRCLSPCTPPRTGPEYSLQCLLMSLTPFVFILPPPIPLLFLMAVGQMHGLAIRRNTIQCMQAIIEAMGALKIELTGDALLAAGRVAKLDESAELTPGVVQVGGSVPRRPQGGCWSSEGASSSPTLTFDDADAPRRKSTAP